MANEEIINTSIGDSLSFSSKDGIVGCGSSKLEGPSQGNDFERRTRPFCCGSWPGKGSSWGVPLVTPVTGPYCIVLEPTVGMKYKKSQRRSHKQQVAK